MTSRAAASYRAEAAEWRQFAEAIAAINCGLSEAVHCWPSSLGIHRYMYDRLQAHHGASARHWLNYELCPTCGQKTGRRWWEDFTQESRILAALFLALECEDDARAAR